MCPTADHVVPKRILSRDSIQAKVKDAEGKQEESQQKVMETGLAPACTIGCCSNNIIVPVRVCACVCVCVCV